MSNKHYLRISGNTFGFIPEGDKIIENSDIELSIEDYDKFFELQSKGKEFRLKSVPTGTGLFDYIEEYTSDVIIDNSPTMEDRLKAVELVLLEVL